MAFELTGIDLSFIAAEDLSTHQYRFVVMASDVTVRMADAVSDFPLGILQNDPPSGGVAVVRLYGVSKLAVNGAITRGQPLRMEYVSETDNGKGRWVNEDGVYTRAYALMSAGAEDDVVPVLLTVDKGSVSSSSSSNSISSSSSSSAGS